MTDPRPQPESEPVPGDAGEAAALAALTRCEAAPMPASLEARVLRAAASVPAPEQPAFERAFEAHRDDAWTLLLALLGGPDAARDALEETFVSLGASEADDLPTVLAAARAAASSALAKRGPASDPPSGEVPFQVCPLADELLGRVRQRAARERERRAGVEALSARVAMRCTYCHAPLARDESVFCAGCLAPHHQDCFRGHGRCGAPGCGEVATVRAVQPDRPRRGRLIRLGAIGTALASAGALAIGAWSDRREAATLEQHLAAEQERTIEQQRRFEQDKRRLLEELERQRARDPAPAPDPARPAVSVTRHTNIYGIPDECRMHTLRCTVPGVGSPSDASPQETSIATELMQRRWTYHAYDLSPDGMTTILHEQDGFEVRRGAWRQKVTADLTAAGPRKFAFHPDSRHALMWCPPAPDQAEKVKRVALVDLDELPGGRPWRVVYDPSDRRHVTGPGEDREVVVPALIDFEWSPRGDAFYVLERRFAPERELESAIVRVELEGERRTEVVRMPGAIDFFMPPTSRFASGGGPSTEDFSLVFGRVDGLFVTDPLGRQKRRLTSAPAVALHNLEWNPAPNTNQLLLFFKGQTPDGLGVALSGVLLVHLDRFGRASAERPWMEQLYDKLDVHTLAYSPRGTYASWGAREFAAFRRPDDALDEATVIVCRGEGAPLEVKGLCWHPSERFLAITAGSRLFVHDVVRGQTREVARFGDDDARNFVAQPSWVGDQVLLTRFEDVAPDEWGPRVQLRRRE